MNLNEIKKVLDSRIPNDAKERLILLIIADDKNAIPTILQILENERNLNKDLIADSNMELSRALVVLKSDNLKWSKKIIADPKWVAGEIIKHYKKWSKHIKCNFKIDELE